MANFFDAQRLRNGDFGLSGKTAIVLGSGPGFGRETARLLAAGGASVACLDLDVSRASETAKLILDEGAAAHAYQADAMDAGSIEDVFERVSVEVGAIDVLVNVVGITIVSPIKALRLEDWDQQIGINLRQQFIAAQCAVRHMAGRGGSIVMIGSINGLTG